MAVRLNYATIETVNALIASGFTREQAEKLVKVFSNTEHENVYSTKEVDQVISETIKTAIDDVMKKHKKDAWVAAGTISTTILVGFFSVAIAVYFGLK
ncbi:hypothetical protein [Cysteiniphilum marinum]|uniref:hypothetical protein n=1 Tax=Cysteiniphilum marinum TaxID=2774191 RepID=UPI001939ADB3|nr:hypothetical protein [Cysteiniphilum marinum]